MWGLVQDGEDVVKKDKEDKEKEKVRKEKERKSGKITRDPPKR